MLLELGGVKIELNQGGCFRKMSVNDVVSGYLDVKISSKSRRGLTPWKVSFYCVCFCYHSNFYRYF